MCIDLLRSPLADGGQFLLHGRHGLGVLLLGLAFLETLMHLHKALHFLDVTLRV